MPPASRSDRRNFLLVGGAAAIAGGLTVLGAKLAANANPAAAGYGQLQPVKDETTGLALLKLPDGFRYRSFAWTGDPLTGGGKSPGAHDGMAVVKADGDRITLVRNQEIAGKGKAFGDPKSGYDPSAPGGCVNLVFNTATGNLEKSFVSLNGTLQNCSGGATPWGTWLSGEENLGDPGTLGADKQPVGYEREHGW